ncbi:hypothetical protein N7448_006289 [Penicillium atrosanguineum]|uniref:WD repeat protein n=1 Tax=Penicillium atrosanguineum TaxID=1132637 RepID=A0A9W9GZD0_9EURO|nr:uncharacterized protein N7443_010050 [Penicillium atrosanguineum]KAJ5132131.1 hypothetical protein N7448_006289 [Penicillium atrosanguineum]KAJ5289797.1 hypothetical protein N7443_010050 [Penicillium atrosanguineum]KAJ5307619.1 hypothetical protein N7476_008275 [Penicillium atrosanguineum]
MLPSLELVDACLPISALKTFDWNDGSFIFQGQGPFLRVVEDRTGNVAAQVQIFRRNNVHGFIILPERKHEDAKDTTQIIVWGGKSVRAVDLKLGSDNAVTLCISSAEFQAPDWIMSGCAAVLDQPDTAYLVTANNALLSLKLSPAVQSKYRLKVSIYQLATSVKCILYAVDLIALSASHILIAAGTVFGEIIVWSCFIKANGPSKLNAVGSIHHYFTGHDGSIFGVRISPKLTSLNGGKSGRLLASCSDDRTIRIWDISDCENKSPQDPSAYSTDGFELRGTGFGATQGDPGLTAESCVSKAFGHISRIWSVNFRPLREDQPNKMGLVSRSEDATCAVWDLTWKSDSAGATKYDLRETSSSLLHSGKNLWSLDLCSRGEETAVYSGGADGALNNFIVKETCATDIAPSGHIDGSTKGRPSKIGTKAFGFVSPDCFVACSASAELQLGHIGAGENANITWETLCTAKDPRTFFLIAGFPQKRLALIGSGQGSFQLYRHDSKSLSRLVDIGGRPIGLIALETSQPDAISFLAYYPMDNTATLVSTTGLDDECPKTEVVTFSLPQAPFAVSAASLICDGQYLMIGSKLGGLAVYRVSDLGMNSQPLIEDRRVHGRDATNHIQVVPSTEEFSSSNPEYVLTCGRDGFFCLLELYPSDVGSISFEAVHRSYSGLAGNIGGAYFDEASGDLMIYGFRSQSFVLRNESKQKDIISIPSGGARRGWAFNPKATIDNEAVLLWKDGHDMYTRRIRTDLNRCLRAGNHGREIKSMDSVDSIQGRRSLFVTGSEDTTVRIFALSSPASASPWGSFECLRTLDTHRTGIQQVSLSKDGQYLFTSSGFEEFFVWKIKFVPSFGLATILLAASPKDDPNSELRVTSFDMVEVRDSGAGQEFLLCLTLSNSTFKIFNFSPSNAKFTLLARGTYMTNCLTQGHFWVKDSSVSLITAATDGFFTLWDLTTTLEPFYTVSSSIVVANPSLGSSAISPEEISCESRYQIHSNSIKAIELISISETTTVIVAGGDDNSISVSLLKTDTDGSAQVITVSIPDAHTAATTTLKVLRRQTSRATGSDHEFTTITFASSSNDHRVKIWSIIVDPTQHDAQAIRLNFLLDRYSAVADLSSLALIKTSENEGTLLVGGVGMEMFQIKL